MHSFLHAFIIFSNLLLHSPHMTDGLGNKQPYGRLFCVVFRQCLSIVAQSTVAPPLLSPTITQKWTP